MSQIVSSPGDLQGLAEHRDELGAPLCPCRHYDDKAAEAKQGFWNCPCVPMRERKVHGLLGVRSRLHMHCTVCSICVLQYRDVYGTIRPDNTHYFMQECHCMLFLTEDNDFRGEDQSITIEEVIESTKGMSGVQQT